MRNVAMIEHAHSYGDSTNVRDDYVLLGSAPGPVSNYATIRKETYASGRRQSAMAFRGGGGGGGPMTMKVLRV